MFFYGIGLLDLARLSVPMWLYPATDMVSPESGQLSFVRSIKEQGLIFAKSVFTASLKKPILTHSTPQPMLLYSTILHLKNMPVRYEVSWQQENKLLLYRPVLSSGNQTGIPMFYVTRQKGEWLPVNIKDQTIIDQVTKDPSARCVSPRTDNRNRKTFSNTK